MARKKSIENQDGASDIDIDSIGGPIEDVQGVQMKAKSTAGGSGWSKGQPVYWDDVHQCATANKGKRFKCIGVGFEDTSDAQYEARVRMKESTSKE